MWYFYRKFDSEELVNLIDQVNDLFYKIFAREDYIYPEWMKEVKLKVDFENLKQAYEASSEEEMDRLAHAFEKNIQVENICKKEIVPISYDELLIGATEKFQRCIEILKSIQGYLYDNLLKLKGLEGTVGTFKNYYEKFYDETIDYVCPFCALSNMLTSKDLFREAFDHYLPKSKYPFVSFLRENLFPICHTCNSTYKGDKNPKDYGKSFYPFTSEHNDCNLSFKITAGEIVNMNIQSEHFFEEVETWDKLFDIKNRLNNFASVNLSGWVSNIQEAVNNGADYEQAINAEINRCNPKMQDHNFIKEAIFKAL